MIKELGFYDRSRWVCQIMGTGTNNLDKEELRDLNRISRVNIPPIR